MNDADSQKLQRVLEEIRDDQKLQLERQTEALALQRAQLEIVRRQAEGLRPRRGHCANPGGAQSRRSVRARGT